MAVSPRIDANDTTKKRSGQMPERREPTYFTARSKP